jgi:hypothetical protein
MVPPPVAQGLTLCKGIIVEEGTRNVTLVNTFSNWHVTAFPSTPQPMFAVAILRDAVGSGTMELVITREETDEVIYSLSRVVQFKNRLADARATVHVQDCSFPAAGLYYATLLIDKEWIAHRRFRVSLSGGGS